MTSYASFAVTMLGFAFLGNLIAGIVGYAIGRITAKRGPTKTIETYQGEGIPF